MPQAQPQDRQPIRTREEANRVLVEEFKTRTWTPANIRSVDPNMILAALSTLSTDQPATTNFIKPSQMTAEQFHRMLVREAQRRGLLDDYFSVNIDAENLQSVRNDNTITNAVRSFVRNSFSFPNDAQGSPANLQLTPGQVAIYDAGTDMFFRNQSNSALSSDVARALNLPRKADGTSYTLGTHTDIDNFTLGYALGAMSELNPANPNAQTTVRATVDNTPDNIQAAFCREVPKLFEAGRSMEPRDAGVAGFMQGRIDARTNFEGRETEVGLFAPCPTPANTNVPVARTASNQR